MHRKPIKLAVVAHKLVEVAHKLVDDAHKLVGDAHKLVGNAHKQVDDAHKLVEVKVQDELDLDHPPHADARDRVLNLFVTCLHDGAMSLRR